MNKIYTAVISFLFQTIGLEKIVMNPEILALMPNYSVFVIPRFYSKSKTLYRKREIMMTKIYGFGF